jgi:hypothetical protein
MELKPGANLLLQNQGDGWFPLAPSAGINATIVRAIAPTSQDSSFYLLQLIPPLEIQEQTNATPSGLQSIIYKHAVIKSRWQGVAIGSEQQVSVFFLLPPTNAALPNSESECASLKIRAWLSCTIV